MSDEPMVPFDGDSEGRELPPEFEELLRSMFGESADEAIEAIKESGFDPKQLFETAGLPNDPATMRFMVSQVQRMLATSDGETVNWQVAHDLARQAASQGGDPVVGAEEQAEVNRAFTLAEQWLDDVTDFSSSGLPVQAMSSAQWVEATMPRWQKMSEPVAKSVAEALVATMTQQAEDHPGLPDFASGATNMVRTMGGSVFGMQVGQAVGAMARDVFGLTDISIPLGVAGQTAMLPAVVARFCEGLDTPDEEVRLFLAVREAAHARLFTHVAWLGGYVLGLVETYARGISIDIDKLEEQVRSIDPSDQEALRRALSGGVFELEATDAQKAALEQLETALALVEGWVDTLSVAAAKPYLPGVEGLREMIRRRRVAGGPAERTFATLVGLQLRPRRARDAADLWAAIETARGPAGRDSQWSHPDLMPTAQDLDDPNGFLARREAVNSTDAALDAALEEILRDAESAKNEDAESAKNGDDESGDNGEKNGA